MADFKSLLTAINAGLGVIRTVASTPGVNMLPYVSTVAGAASVLQFALERGVNIAENVTAFTETFSNGIPPQEKLDALDARISALRAKIHMPLPPQEDGEPE